LLLEKYCAGRSEARGVVGQQLRQRRLGDAELVGDLGVGQATGAVGPLLGLDDRRGSQRRVAGRQVAEVVGELGELVITALMPSMPVGFWGDKDGSRYRSTYFETYPGVWRHGDWIRFSETGSCMITGRSDATLNRGGVRLGTAEFYRVVEELTEVADSLVVHLEDPAGGPGQLLLYVQLRPGAELDDALRRKITTALRTSLSPRHIPDGIAAIPVVPRNRTGKKLELPAKQILLGARLEDVASRDVLADPTSLDPYVEQAVEQTTVKRTARGAR